MKNTQGLVNALEVVVSNYREHAAEALKSGDSKILVPASLTVEGLDYVTRHPEGIVSQGNEGTEPCYVSLDEANRGRNTDGTSHLGYMVIDVISREVVDLIGRDGKSKLTESKDFGVKSISGHDAGLGISLEDDVTLLSKEIGNYVLFGSVRDFYASLQCRCPCLDADVFSEEDLANKKLEELRGREQAGDYKVQQITPEFLRGYVEK